MTHLENTQEYWAQTVVDAVALLPVAGIGKYADEATAIAKNTGKVVDAGDAVKSVKKGIPKVIIKNGDKADFIKNYISVSGKKVAKKEILKNTLKNYKTKKWNVAGNIISFDKRGMKHVLERHHPKFWDGTTKSMQTFLNENLTVNDVKDIVSEIIKQNMEKHPAESALGGMAGMLTGTVAAC